MFGKHKKLIRQPQLPDSAAKLILVVKWLSGKMIDKHKKLDSKVEVINLNLVTFGFGGKMTEKHVKTL